MISTTWLSDPVIVLDNPIDWGQGFATSWALPSDIERGLTQIEERTNRGGFLRLSSVRFACRLDNLEAAELAEILREVQATPVIVPFWPADRAWADRLDRGFDSQLWWSYTATQGELHTFTTTPSFGTTGARTVPCARGFMEATIEWTNSGQAYLDVKFTESASLYSERLYPTAPASAWHQLGPSVNGENLRVFPFRWDWAGPLRQSVGVEIERGRAPYSRAFWTTFYDQFTRRGARANLRLTSDEAAALLEFFQITLGATGPFWLPTEIELARLTAPAAAGASTATVNAADHWRDHDHAFFSSGADRQAAQVALPPSGDSVSLVGDTFDHSFPAGTLVSPLLVARFASGQISIKWNSPEDATASVEFQELPEEAVALTGETFGETHSYIGTEAFVYSFVYRRTANGTLHQKAWTLTTWERDLDIEGTLAETNQHLQHTAPDETLNLETSKLRLEGRIWEGSPFELYQPYQLEGRLRLQVYKVKVNPSPGWSTADLANLELIHSGELRGVTFTGPKFSAESLGVGRHFQRKFPAVLVQRSCNWTLFSGYGHGVRCNLNPALWRFTGELVSSSTNQVVLNNIQRPSGTLPTLSAHYFANGRMETGAPASDTFETRTIRDSTAQSGGEITLTLDRPLNLTPAGTFNIWPGCNRQLSTCRDKFDNLDQFGGHPHVPVANPTWPVRETNTQIGKKG